MTSTTNESDPTSTVGNPHTMMRTLYTIWHGPFPVEAHHDEKTYRVSSNTLTHGATPAYFSSREIAEKVVAALTNEFFDDFTITQTPLEV